MIGTDALLDRLAARRPIFHSEADLQHALAWEIALAHPEARVRLEVPFGGEAGRTAMDVIIHQGGEAVGFELKYWRLGLEHDHDGETFRLRTTGANDISRYDAVKDLARLERAVGEGIIRRGYLVALTNDSKFWREGMRPGTADAAFHLGDGRTLAGEMTWAAHAGAGTTKGREATIRLAGTYPLTWRGYSRLDARHGEFRALIVPVEVGAEILRRPERVPILVACDASSGGRKEGRAALGRCFGAIAGDEIGMTFDEVEELYGPLPPSATLHNAWWHHVASHPHAVWELHGFFASPDLGARQVRFRRRSA